MWGKSIHVDLHGCNNYVKNPKKIEEFVAKLCEEINMKRHGPLHLDYFGEGNLKGYSCMQFIETSSITAHFDHQKGKPYRAFIDIFSCKDFDEKKTGEFCKNYFSAEKINSRTLIRK